MLKILLILSSLAQAAHWTDHALRLTGESLAVRNNAIRALKAIPNLDAELQAAFQTRQKYLALDVISALARQNLLPFLSTTLTTDESGATTLAVQSLLSEGTRERIVSIFRDGVASNGPPASRMVMWDTLGRLAVAVEQTQVLQALRDDSFEVRDAALYYTRLLARASKQTRWLVPLREALSLDPFQLRLRAIHAIHDLPASLKIEGRKLLELCRKDKVYLVREACK